MDDSSEETSDSNCENSNEFDSAKINMQYDVGHPSNYVKAELTERNDWSRYYQSANNTYLKADKCVTENNIGNMCCLSNNNEVRSVDPMEGTSGYGSIKTEAERVLETASDVKNVISKEEEYNRALKQKLLDCLEIVACEYGANAEALTKQVPTKPLVQEPSVAEKPSTPPTNPWFRRINNTEWCVICGEAFPDMTALKGHECFQNTEKPHKCNECSKSFSRNYSLVLHKRIHSGEKPYTCEFCFKSFALNHNLNLHKRVHSGEKPYKCDICQKMFAQSHHLNVHKRIHSGEKPYKCDECSKSFSQSIHLTVHKRVHSGEKPFKCDECSKSFSQIFYLTRHQRTHTGEKPYECDECSKTFSHRHHLNLHKRIHSGEKPYKCEECSKCFTQISHLKQHLKTHTTTLT